eukprot:TRINITY_DN15048_c0_g1_i3.p1 TRINITY_DN15048_c0_g1~~TRINITY_DN15048_c0_g1_i3.p1  ORF type:complete len:716 (+),score=136.22 TRINITY_DN15048_c0_g1_i3:178-2148(+)
MGKLKQAETLSSAGSVELLKSLLPLAARGLAGGADCAILLGGKEAARAHRPILMAHSAMLKCKFDGRFADSEDSHLCADGFSRDVVIAVVSFSYLGTCTIREDDLGAVHELASFWGMKHLTDAVVRHAETLPAVICLHLLSSLPGADIGEEPSAENPEAVDGGGILSETEALRDALVKRTASRFDQAAKRLTVQTGKPVSVPAEISMTPGSAESRPSENDAPDDDTVIRQARQQRAQDAAARAPGWKFLRELGDGLKVLAKDRLEVLRSTFVAGRSNGGDGPLADSLARLMATALAVSRPEDLPVLRPLEVLLADAVTLDIASRLKVTPGLADDVGNLQVWVSWACDGSRRFSQLGMLHGAVRSISTLELDRVGTLEQAREQDMVTMDQVREQRKEDLGTLVDGAFARGFAASLAWDKEAADAWEGLLEARPHCGALRQSLQIIARLTHRGRGALGSLPARTVLRILREVVPTLPSEAVLLRGPENIAGIYRAGTRNGVTGAPLCEFFGPNGLVLRRSMRSGANRARIVVSWEGVTRQELQDARAEWKVMVAEDDPETGFPLALAFAAAQDPALITGTWYVRALRRDQKTRYRAVDPGAIAVRRDAAPPAAVAPIAACLATWAARCGASSSAFRFRFLHGPPEGGARAWCDNRMHA